MGEQTGAAGLHDPRLHVGGVSLARREGRLGRSDSSSPASALAIHLWAVCLLTPASRATADTLSPARTSSTSLCRPRGASRELERWSKGPLSLQPSTSHSLEESSPFVTSCVNNLLAHNS